MPCNRYAPFWRLEDTAAFFFQEGVNIFKRELSSLVDKIRSFLKVLEQATKSIQIQLPEPTVEVGSTEAIVHLFAQHCEDVIDYAHGQSRLLYLFGNNKSCVSCIKKFQMQVLILYLQKWSTLNVASFPIFTRTDITLQKSYKYLRAIGICSAITPDCGYNNSSINLNGDVYCLNTKCSGKLCLHEMNFKSLSGSVYQCTQCASLCQVRNILFEDQTKYFFLTFVWHALFRQKDES